MRIAEIENEIIEEFELFGDDWEGKYEHLIDLGNHLPLIDKQHKTDDRLIKGCQSRVWLHSELYDEKVVFTADSDAIITKGIVAILIRVFSGQTPEEIMQADLKFIDDIGLKEHLSPTRANGLVSTIKQIKMYAIALNLSQNS
ncbi:SufE family protein [Psychroserpens burtonensis]|uniref:SufE family protein n=1 Tax=Psychroserpens burtonensis TaxID=49278 RepID=A0A5C7BC54_9FLAO|nr:SufE family protein [Psychroserpens burtonensis]TXE15497.1 SufE family protein [Psychroserpens burtonensis]